MADRKPPRGPGRFDPFAQFDLLAGWSPFRDPGPSPLRRARLLGQAGAPRRSALAPAVDIAEDEERYVVTVELPGSKKEDITVEMQGDVLTIRGEKRNEREGRKEQHRWLERCYGSFSRSFTLPADAAGDRIRAEFREGVLTIEVPRSRRQRSRRISIE